MVDYRDEAMHIAVVRRKTGRMKQWEDVEILSSLQRQT